MTLGRKGRVLCLFLLAGIFLSVGSVFLAGPAGAEKLRIGIDQSFPPFTYENEADDYAGLHTEIIKGALDGAGIGYEIRGYPWKRLVLLVDLGDLDLALPFRHKPERFEKYNMVGPFTKTGSRTFLFGLRNNDISWDHLTDLQGHVIGLIDGFAYPESVEQAVYLDFYRLNGSTRKLALMLRLKRIDLLVSDETVFWDSVRREEMANAFKPVGQPLDHVMRYVAMPKAKAELAAKVQAALDTFKGRDQYSAILAEYGLQP